jgi:hypothetical protein
MRFYQLIIIIFTITTISFFLCSKSFDDWRILAAWIKKDLYIEYFDIGYKEFKLPWKCGFEIFMTKSEMINDEFILAVIKKFKITFLADLISTLLISLAVNFYVLFLTEQQIKESTALKDKMTAKDEKIMNLNEKLNSLPPKEQPKPRTDKISISERI